MNIGLKPVYCYYFPESRKVVQSVDNVLHDKSFFLTQTSVKYASEILAKLHLSETVDLPAHVDRTTDLDMIHDPLIELLAHLYEPVVPALKEFSFRYVTSGSSEGLFKYLIDLKHSQGIDTIYTLLGEYEGYREYGKTLGIQTIEFDPLRDNLCNLKPGVWFVSNPSARDGNIIPDSFIQGLCERGNKVVLDLAYVGSTNPRIFDVSHPNVVAVLLSMSKPYGVFWERVGFTFSREPIQSLYANKWFKSIRSLVLGVTLVDKVSTLDLYTTYKPVQSQIIDFIRSEFGVELACSDVLLLGHNPSYIVDQKKDQRALLADYKRGNAYRVCLTPHYETFERETE